MTNITEAINDALLNNLCCGNCNRLLSVAPTLITSTGFSICGRCPSNVSTSFVKNVQYDTLSRQFNFPCSYASEGCKSTPNYSLIKKHEACCPYRTLTCYCKDCQWSGIVIDLIIHYTEFHPDLVIDAESEQELKDDKLCYVLAKSNFYFMLNYEYSNSVLTLKISNLTCPTTDASYTCKLLNLRDIIDCISLRPDEKTVTKITSKPGVFIITIQLGAYLPKSIQCPQCRQLMTPPILKCPLGHVTCADCFDTAYNYCITCEKDDLSFARDHGLEIEAALTMYTCRWADCGLTFSIKDIQEHESICTKRLYKCLHFCPEDWEGFLGQLVEHDITCAKKNNTCRLETATFVTFLCNDVPESNQIEFHLLAFKELFRLMIDFEVWGIKISVINYCLPSLYGWFQYEVDLAHSKRPHCPFNKTLHIKHRTCNLFSLSVLGEDTMPFGGFDFLKMTVRIVFLNESERKMNVDRLYRCYR